MPVERAMIAAGTVRTVFMGTSAFAVPSLRALVRAGYEVEVVVTQPPRPAGRRRRLTPTPVMEEAEALGLPVMTPERLRAPESVADLAIVRPDLIVVAAYAQFLPVAVLEMPGRGCLNVHGSLLPRWRGASPIQSAILAGDDFTGVSVMLMEPSMDTGPILAESLTRIEDGDTAVQLEDRLSRGGAQLLVDVLPCYLEGRAQPVAQVDELATYAPIIKKDHGLIDWSRSAVEIWRANRAYRAWPGTFTHWRGQLLKVIACVPGRQDWSPEEPGTVVSLEEGRGAGVVTGDGVLVLEEVSMEGGRAMGLRDFLAGHRDFPGSRLG